MPKPSILERLGNLFFEFAPKQDAGMTTHFRPAQAEKPGKFGIVSRISTLFGKRTGYVDPRNTTEQGTSGTASRSAFPMALYNLRYDRQAKIADCREMYDNDPRCRKAVNKFAHEAVRSGVTITVTKRALRGLPAKWSTVATDSARRVQKIVNRKCTSWAKMLPVEGDLFIQAVVATDIRTQSEFVVEAKRMPASSMERLTDDTDEFINIERAFEQIDVSTSEHVAYFCSALMNHSRWDHIDGDRYGNPELLAARRVRRLLELCEQSQVLRRLVRAPQRIVWNLGSETNTSRPEDVIKFMTDYGFLDGDRDPYDVMNAVMDYFGNGTLKGEVLEGDPDIDKIEDLRYYQELYAVALPTPAPLLNLNASNINRDVLENQRAEWLKETSILSDAMVEVVRWLMDLDLMLHGILPEMVNYDVHFSESTIETPGEIMDNVLKLRQNVVGQGNTSSPDPMISKETALKLLKEFLDVHDIDAELALIQEEESKRMDQQLQFMQANVTGRVTPVGQATSSAAPSKTVSSRSKRKAGKDTADDDEAPENGTEAYSLSQLTHVLTTARNGNGRH